MGRYIEIDALWKCETCFHHQNGKCNTWCECGEAYRPAYSKLAIIEGEIVTHGRWMPCGFGREIMCSVCRCELNDGWEYRYCPDCGAKMDLKE